MTTYNNITKDFDVKNSIFRQINCCSLGEIQQLYQSSADKPKQEMTMLVSLGYKLSSAQTQGVQPLIYCTAIRIEHCEFKYEVGDIVLVAFTDYAQHSYLVNKNLPMCETTNDTQRHNLTNGIVLFPLKVFDNTSNDRIKIYNDENKEQITLAHNNIEIDNTYTDDDTTKNTKTNLTLAGNNATITHTSNKHSQLLLMNDTNNILQWKDTENNITETLTQNANGTTITHQGQKQANFTLTDNGITVTDGNGNTISTSSSNINITSGAKLNIAGSAGGIGAVFKAIEAYVNALVITSPQGTCTINDSAGKSAFEAKIDGLFES